MIKTAIISLNLFALIGYKLFFGGDVKVNQSFPDQLAAGESFIVEIQIEKGDREGFAKWQQNIPTGFIATAKETQGATFSFKGQEVKLIWMALPKTETFTITYEVKLDPTTEGQFELEGKFSYIEENERKDISVDKRTITIGAKNELAEKVTPPEVKLDTAKEEEQPIEDEENTENNETAENLETNTEDSQENELTTNEESNETLVAQDEGISIYRKLSAAGTAKYKVELIVEKGNLESFGKVEEYLPPGFIASEDANADGMFSFNNKVMKILWMTLPAGNTINLSYFIESTSDEQEIAQLHGVFSYLKENESKQLPLKPTTFENSYQSEELVEEELNEKPEEVEEIAELAEEKEESLPIKEEIVAKDKLEEKTAVVKETVINTPPPPSANAIAEKRLVDEITNIPAPETSIIYKVQIAASKSEVKQKYFVDKHNISEQVAIESHNGWFKYTLGGYDIYKKARDRRNEIWSDNNKINDAFVTAYNAGERISVQEALMISNQKWFK